MDDMGISRIVGDLFQNTTLKSLDLSLLRRLTSTSWHILSGFLKTPQCLLESVYLGGDSEIDDEGAISLGDAFAANRTLKYIDFNNNFTISSRGWQELARGFGASSLEEIILSDCSIDDDGAFDLFETLTASTLLKKLDISGNYTISEAGWNECLLFLQDSAAPFEELHFRSNNIGEFGAHMLIELVAGIKTTIRYLDVRNIAITNDELSIFARLLHPSSSSQLQDLRIGSYQQNDVNDEVVKCFAAALTNNTSLTNLAWSYVRISSAGCSALVDAVCDANSISGISNSNHTLCSISCGNMLPEVLTSLLRLNANENKAAVVRQKVSAYYLSDMKTAGRVFGSMSETTLPIATSWIGRDRHGYSAMFSVVRNMLLKFDT